jgi:WD40 repeat protein
MHKLGWIFGGLLLLALATHAQPDTRLTPQTLGTMRQIAVIPNETGSNIFGMAWSPDSDEIALATARGIEVYRFTPERIQLRRLIDYDTFAIRVAWSPDGRLLVSGFSFGGRLWFWDAATGEQLYSVTGGSGESELNSVEFSPDGTLLATYTLSADEVRLWGVVGADGAREPLARANISRIEQIGLLTHDDSVGAMAFSPDGTRLATSAQDGRLRLWDTADFSVVDSFSVDYATGIAWLPDASALFATEYPGGALLRIDPLTSLSDRLPVRTGVEQPWRIALSPDGSLLARGYYTLGVSQIDLWDVEAGAAAGRLEGLPYGVTDIAFSPDGTRLATNGWGDTVRIWGAGAALDVVTDAPSLTVGERARVDAVGDSLNLRGGAGTSFPVLTTLPDDTLVEVIGGPQGSDGYVWWLVRTADGFEGWAVERIGESLTLLAE